MDVVRPQPGPPPAAGCLRALLGLLVLGALLLLAGVVAAGALLLDDLGAADAAPWTVAGLLVALALVAGAVGVALRASRPGAPRPRHPGRG